MSITLHINQGIRVFFADFTCVCNTFLNVLLDFNSFKSFGKLFDINCSSILKRKFSIICSFKINVYF